MTTVDNWPRVIQLAWQVCNMQGEVISENKHLITPNGWTIPKEKFWIDNGYSTESNLAKGIPMETILPSFLKDYEGSEYMIAHNIAFDYPVLGAELLRYNMRANKSLPRLCTMQSSIDLCRLPGKFGFKFPKLEELHHFLFNEGFDGAHDAMADVNACRRCFFELVNKGIINI